MASMFDQKAWEAKEQEIIERYGKEEVHRMRRQGYSGLSVEKRAEAIGLLSMYQSCYRIASRSVHTFDPAETGIMDYTKDQAAVDDLLASRRETLESTQNMLMGRLAFLLNEIIDDPRSGLELLLLGLGYEKYRDSQDGVTDTSEDDKGNFYIWRE